MTHLTLPGTLRWSPVQCLAVGLGLAVPACGADPAPPRMFLGAERTIDGYLVVHIGPCEDSVLGGVRLALDHGDAEDATIWEASGEEGHWLPLTSGVATSVDSADPPPGVTVAVPLTEGLPNAGPMQVAVWTSGPGTALFFDAADLQPGQVVVSGGELIEPSEFSDRLPGWCP